MKYTRTQIFIEIEETVTVRMAEKQTKSESVLDPQWTEHPVCPFCGRETPEIKSLEKGE